MLNNHIRLIAIIIKVTNAACEPQKMAKTTAWDKFLLLSWKNWLTQFRHPIQTVFEVLIPISVCAFLILIRALVDVSKETEPFLWRPIRIDNFFFDNRIPAAASNVIAYSPASPVLHDIMNKVADKIFFNNTRWIIEVFPNGSLLEGNAIANDPFVSVEFDQSLAGSSELPDDIRYTMRFPAELRTPDGVLDRMAGFSSNWATNIRFALDFIPGPRSAALDDGGDPGYIRVSEKVMVDGIRDLFGAKIKTCFFCLTKKALKLSKTEAFFNTCNFPPARIHNHPKPD